MRNRLLGAVLLALLATACSNSVGLWPGRTYAVFLRLPSPVISLRADFEADIDVLNLTGKPLEFSFCDGGQYSLTMRDALNRVVFWSPTAVITMPTGFTVPPYGVHTLHATGTNLARWGVMPGPHRLSGYIQYNEQPCAQTAVLVVP
jgi:hypothetical protein